MNLRKAFLSAFNVVIFLLLVHTLFSCSLFNSDNATSSKIDEPIPVPFEALGNDSVYCGLNYLDCESEDDLSCVELIFDNESDFNKYITCKDSTNSRLQVVDFDENFVLAGRTSTQPNMPKLKEQSVTLESDTLKYKVTIAGGIITIPGGVIYMIVVSKKYSGYPVDFIIVKEN
jgi:hypothetical protein